MLSRFSANDKTACDGSLNGVSTVQKTSLCCTTLDHNTVQQLTGLATSSNLMLARPSIRGQSQVCLCLRVSVKDASEGSSHLFLRGRAVILTLAR